MSFSASVRITDLNDFISPSTECIKPLAPAQPEPVHSIQIRNPTDFSQIPERSSGSAKVTLNDCLACSGCITSAETVLIGSQSVDRLLETIEDSKKDIVFSISPQSRASIATHFDLDILSAAKRLTGFLKRECRARYVLDAGLASDIALVQQRTEFIRRFGDAKLAQSPKMQLPLLTSECPGWICYAEKTQPDVLPYLSTVRSAQQIMGTTIHTFLGLEDAYHVAIMPCFDKKLEASRQEFKDHVDLVLSTSEICSFIEGRVGSLTQVVGCNLDDNALLGVKYCNQIIGVEDSLGSGAYLDHVFRYAASTLFHVDIEGPLEFKQIGRNSDFKETILEIDGKKVLRFAFAYGFRNIQNLVRKIKSGNCPYHFVEVMACPSGCLNGGGQIRAQEAGMRAQQQLLSKVAHSYNQFDRHDPEIGPAVLQLNREWIKDHESRSKDISDHLHTSYRSLQSESLNPLQVNW